MSEASQKILLTVGKQVIQEPLVYNLGHQFQLITNIRGASVTDDAGLVALELKGEREEIDRAIQFLIDKGVKVEPMEGE